MPETIGGTITFDMAPQSWDSLSVLLYDCIFAVVVFYDVVTPSGEDSLRPENINSAQNGDQAFREREMK